VFALNSPMESLSATSSLIARVDLRRLSFDAFCPLLSLPHVLGIARELPLPTAPYLSADPLQVAAWRARYARQGRRGHRKVGLVWQDNPADVALSPSLMRAQELTPLAQLEGIDLVNLQQGPVGRELARIAPQAIDPIQTPLALDEFVAALAATRSRGERRYHGGALRRRARERGLRDAARAASLVLGRGTQLLRLVPGRATFPARRRIGLVEDDGGCHKSNAGRMTRAICFGQVGLRRRSDRPVEGDGGQII
jgi:hypothetical protein